MVKGSLPRSREALMQAARAFFTPLVLTKMALLTLLSVQIGFQPLLMGWYAREARGVGLRVGVIEGMKFVMGLVPLLLTGEWAPQLQNWSLHVALQTTAAPALIYVLQNYLNQAAVVVLDGVTFNILNQTKIIWTALLVYVMLRQYQSKQQIVALTILCAAAVLMTTGKTADVPTNHPRDTDAAFFTGTYQALIAAILSALAGTIIQRALQSQQRNAYLVTMELSILGELTILLWTMTTSDNGFFSKPQPPAVDGGALGMTTVAAATEPVGMWDGWTAFTFLALFCQACGGVVVGFVIKYCGNVEKSFAVVFGMIITALLEKRCNDKPFGGHGVVAIVMVTLATVMYTAYPPKQPPQRRHTGATNKSSTLPTTVTELPRSASLLRFYTKKANAVGKKDSETTDELEPFLSKTAGAGSASSTEKTADPVVA